MSSPPCNLEVEQFWRTCSVDKEQIAEATELDIEWDPIRQKLLVDRRALHGEIDIVLRVHGLLHSFMRVHKFSKTRFLGSTHSSCAIVVLIFVGLDYLVEETRSDDGCKSEWYLGGYDMLTPPTRLLT